MENQHIPDPSNALDNFFSIAFDETTRTHIRSAANWAKIIALCAFTGYGLSLVAALFAPSYRYAVGSEGLHIENLARTSNLFGVMITIIIGGFINFYLYRFATATVKGMDAMDGVKTAEGFNSLRIYFKIYGVLLIIVLSLAVLFVLFFLIGMGLAGR